MMNEERVEGAVRTPATARAGRPVHRVSRLLVAALVLLCTAMLGIATVPGVTGAQGGGWQCNKTQSGCEPGKEWFCGFSCGEGGCACYAITPVVLLQ